MELEALKFPLALFSVVEIGTLEGKDGTRFSIVAGLDKPRVAQLKQRSLDKSDSDLQNNTSDYKRFGEGSYESWYAKGRVPFVALDPLGNLAAIIWFGPDEPPALSNGYQYPEKNWDTIAFRSYAPYRGVGIMTPMSIFVVKTHREKFPERTLWLETNIDNEAGKHLYNKLGFADVGVSVRNGRLVMVHHS
jgi:GNAT superfamily N-acetyltransferase